MGIDADLAACRAAEQFVDRNAECFAFDIPQGHVDAAESAGQDGAAAVEGVAVYGLPVMHDLTRVFANEIVPDFLHGRRARLRSAFDDWLAQADDARVGMHLQE